MQIKDRKLKILERLGEYKVSSIYLTNLANVKYATGFTGTAGTALLTPDRSYFLTDFRYREQVKKEITEYDHVIAQAPIDCLREVGFLNDGKAVAFEADHLSVTRLAELKENFPGVEWIPTSLIAERIAAVKEGEEVDAIRQAAVITDSVFKSVLPNIKPGITENEISALITYRSKMSGSEVDPFEPIIASGKRSALPHGISSDKEIEVGDLVILDFGTTVNGYAADMTRTVVVGEPSDEQRKIYEIVLGAQETAIGSARGGMTGAELDAVARNYIRDAGYGEYFGHSLGHGLGLEVHAWPRVSSVNKEALLPGMVVTIEPGIYIPDFGGVRIEDDILITTDGSENLTGSPKELISVG